MFNDLVVDLGEGPVSVHGQIQQYASNSQLLHPLVSPLLSASLGNLCPLYIVAGDREVLRDEAIYLAHRAANPLRYPVREGLLHSEQQKWQMKTFREATKVHLQLIDEFCHVPTIFTFTPAARYIYQSVGEFAKHVIDQEDEPIPPMHSQDDVISGKEGEASADKSKKSVELAHSTVGLPSACSPKEDGQVKGPELRVKPQEIDLPSPSSLAKHIRLKNTSRQTDVTDKIQRQLDLVRERMDFSARLRSINSDDELSVLSISRDDVGVIKAAPVQRWQTGQSIWETKFSNIYSDVAKQRRKYQKRADLIRSRLRDLGLLDDNFRPRHTSGSRVTVFDVVQHEERPPPSAIAGRYDNSASLALLKAELWRCTCDSPENIRARIWNVAPTRRVIPKEFPRQSAAEQQTSPSKLPIHGLTMWMNMTSYFWVMNTRRARKARNKIIATTGADSLTRSLDVRHRSGGEESRQQEMVPPLSN